MGPLEERQLAGIFFRFGQDSCRNVRARVTHYQPWEKDALGNGNSIGNDAISSNISSGAGKSINSSSVVASSALVSKYGNPGMKALISLGFSRNSIGNITRAIRGLRSATKGLNSLGDVYDQLATLGAFSYSDSLLLSRYKRTLAMRSTRSGYEEYAFYVGKLEPFFNTIKEFITLTSISIEAMVSNEIDIFAIEAAFNSNDIPIPNDLYNVFYEPHEDSVGDEDISKEAVEEIDELFE